MTRPAWLGKILFWLVWPVSYVTLHFSWRTRALIVCGDEALVVKGWLSTGKWSLPGGGLHRGESVLDGLLREVREEVGVNVEAEACEPLGTYTFRAAGLPFNCHLFVIYVPIKPKVRLQATELTDFAWVKIININPQNYLPEIVGTVARLAAKS